VRAVARPWRRGPTAQNRAAWAAAAAASGETERDTAGVSHSSRARELASDNVECLTFAAGWTTTTLLVGRSSTLFGGKTNGEELAGCGRSELSLARRVKIGSCRWGRSEGEAIVVHTRESCTHTDTQKYKHIPLARRTRAHRTKRRAKWATTTTVSMCPGETSKQSSKPGRQN
jgi:hypothetical protein